MNLIEQFIELQEINRIVQGFSKKTGKPQDHIQSVWKDTEKEVLLKHKYGVTDKYKQIGRIVRSKLGIKPDAEDGLDSGEEKEQGQDKVKKEEKPDK